MSYVTPPTGAYDILISSFHTDVALFTTFCPIMSAAVMSANRRDIGVIGTAEPPETQLGM